MVISKYRPFPRNIDSLGITAKNNFLGKNQFIQNDLKLSSFSPKYCSLGITAKNNFLGQNQFFHSDLKISPFSPKY